MTEPENPQVVKSPFEPEENRAEHGSQMKAEVPAIEEPVAIEEEPKVVAVPAAAADPKGKKSRPSASSSLPSNTFVQMQALVCCGGAKNSGSVATVQHRLLELGYTQAGDEKRGYFGVNTCSALKEFQADSKIESDSCSDLATIEALFEGTKAEVLP
jgi:Putative peptidoglycan binding domain